MGDVRGSKNPNATLDDAGVQGLLNMVGAGIPYREIAETVGLSCVQVGWIARGQSWNYPHIQRPTKEQIYEARRARELWAKIDKRGTDECWEWTAYRTDDGYGATSYRNRYALAHRRVLELSGVHVPDGLFVCHRCDNPPCCNPAHLFVGTAADNATDRNQKGRTARGPTSSSPLTEEQVRYAFSSYSTGTQTATIAAKLGVHPSTVMKLFKGESWAHLGLRITPKRRPAETVAMVCLTCGKGYQAKAGDVRRGKCRYCSPHCWYAAPRGVR